jgi:hypothetical protein
MSVTCKNFSFRRGCLFGASAPEGNFKIKGQFLAIERELSRRKTKEYVK